MANITGKGAPSRWTIGAIGDIYTDDITGQQYKCIFSYRTDSDKEFNCEWKQIKYQKNSQEIKENILSEKVTDKENKSIPKPPLADSQVTHTKRRDYGSYSKKNR